MEINTCINSEPDGMEFGCNNENHQNKLDSIFRSIFDKVIKELFDDIEIDYKIESLSSEQINDDHSIYDKYELNYSIDVFEIYKKKPRKRFKVISMTPDEFKEATLRKLFFARLDHEECYHVYLLARSQDEGSWKRFNQLYIDNQKQANKLNNDVIDLMIKSKYGWHYRSKGSSLNMIDSISFHNTDELEIELKSSLISLFRIN